MCKIQGLLKVFPMVFKDYKFMNNSDLHVKIYFTMLWKNMEKLVSENEYKIVVTFIGA